MYLVKDSKCMWNGLLDATFTAPAVIFSSVANNQRNIGQAQKEREGERGEKAGGQLLLNDSLAETPGSYIPTQVPLG